MERSPGRRWFLKSVAAVGVAVPAGALGADAQSHHGHGEHVAQAGSVKGQSQPQVYGWLTQPEQAFIEAAVARLIPADELGPGAKEAGVSYFIDQQLAGAYGTMARNYKQGPWPEGTPQQGYQSRLMPQEVYRAAIMEINTYCSGRYGKVFEALPAAQQDEVLGDLEAGKVALKSVGAGFFFGLLLAKWKAFSPIRFTAATATRSVGSWLASLASPLCTAISSISTTCRTTPSRCRSRTCNSTR
jgi:gluconate 2-dehydrogenase gamma chain